MREMSLAESARSVNCCLSLARLGIFALWRIHTWIGTPHWRLSSFRRHIDPSDCIDHTCNIANTSKWAITLYTVPHLPHPRLENLPVPALPAQIGDGLGPIFSEDTPKPASLNLNLTTYLSPVLRSTYAVPRWHILLTIPLFQNQFCLWDNFSVRIPPWPPSVRGSNDERPVSWTPTLFLNLEHAHLQMAQMEFFQQLRSFMGSLIQGAPPEKPCVLRKMTQCPMTLQEMTAKHKPALREALPPTEHKKSHRQ